MDSVGVRELRQNLSVYLQRVRGGETLRVTDRGEAVAVLGPLPEHAHPFDRLVAAGRLLPPARPSHGVGAPLDVPVRQPISEALEQERDD